MVYVTVKIRVFTLNNFQQIGLGSEWTHLELRSAATHANEFSRITQSWQCWHFVQFLMHVMEK